MWRWNAHISFALNKVQKEGLERLAKRGHMSLADLMRGICDAALGPRATDASHVRTAELCKDVLEKEFGPGGPLPKKEFNDAT